MYRLPSWLSASAHATFFEAFFMDMKPGFFSVNQIKAHRSYFLGHPHKFLPLFYFTTFLFFFSRSGTSLAQHALELLNRGGGGGVVGEGRGREVMKCLHSRKTGNESKIQYGRPSDGLLTEKVYSPRSFYLVYYS